MGCVVGQAWDTVGNWVDNNPVAATIAGVATVLTVPTLGLLELGAWLTHDDSDYGKVGLPSLNKEFSPFPSDSQLDPSLKDAITLLPDFYQTFDDVVTMWGGVEEHKTPSDLAKNMGKFASDLETAITLGHDSLTKLLSMDVTEGSMNDAFVKNVKSGMEALTKWATSLNLLAQCIDGYFATMENSRKNVDKAKSAYETAIRTYPEPDQIKAIDDVYNEHAKEIMKIYEDNIKQVSQHHPKMHAADTPPVNPNVPGPTNRGGGGGGPSGSKTGAGTPKIPSPSNLLNKNNPFKQTSNNKNTPKIPTDALSGLGNAAQQTAQQAGNAAGSAAGQAADAAKQALEQALKGTSDGTTALPEGVLGGIGSNALSGLNKAGGVGGGRGGGSAGSSRPTIARPAANTTAASKAPTEAAAKTSRAGVSGTGSAGSGAPAAGHRGGGSDKVHKANKALRHMRNGQEVMGETDAVVSVLGEEPQQAAPTKTT